MATTLERVANAGETRAHAAQEIRAARTALRQAVAVALGAGTETAEIVSVIAGRNASTSRAGAYKICTESAEVATQAWEEAGSPPQDAAVTALGYAEQNTRDARHTIEAANCFLIRELVAGLRAGIVPTVLVAEAQLSQDTGYKFLSIARDHATIRNALGDMLHHNLARVDDMPQVEIGVSSSGVRVCNRGQVTRNGTEEFGGIEEEMTRRLAAAGYTLAAPSTGRWTTVKNTPEKK